MHFQVSLNCCNVLLFVSTEDYFMVAMIPSAIDADGSLSPAYDQMLSLLFIFILLWKQSVQAFIRYDDLPDHQGPR